MRNGERLSLEQIRTFLAVSEEFRFEGNNRKEVYDCVTRTLVEQEYGWQKREPRGFRGSPSPTLLIQPLTQQVFLRLAPACSPVAEEKIFCVNALQCR